MNLMAAGSNLQDEIYTLINEVFSVADSTTLNVTSPVMDTFTFGMTTSSSDDYVMSGQDAVYVTVVLLTSLLSIPSCLVLIALHVAYPGLRNTGRAMLVQLSIADLLTATGNLMGILWYLFRDAGVLKRSMAYCETHSALTIFSSIASFLWTVFIGLALYFAINRSQPNIAVTYWNFAWVVSWGIPTIITVTALALRVLGYDASLHQASWCWIDPKTENPVLWNFLTGKAWELLAYSLTLVLYSCVRINLYRHTTTRREILQFTTRSKQDTIHDANVKLTFIPLVFIVLRLWGTIRFLMGFVDHKYASSSEAFWIVPLQGFGDTAQGFGNFIMDVIFSSNIRRHLVRCYYKADVNRNSAKNVPAIDKISQKHGKEDNTNTTRTKSKYETQIGDVPGENSHVFVLLSL